MQVVLVYRHSFRPNSLLKCASQPEIAKKSTKTPYFGKSRSFKVISVNIFKSSLPVLVMINSMYVPICNHFHVKRANNGRITPSKGGAPLSTFRSWGPIHPAA